MIITIPTCRTRAEVAPQVCEIEGMSYPAPVYASCMKLSAAINRNICLRNASDINVMVDDDIRGFYPGWSAKLVANLASPGVMVVSARLMDKDGGYGPMMGMEGRENKKVVEVPRMPTACIAFRVADAVEFDERFLTSGYEDVYWCWCMKKKYPTGRLVVDNSIKLVHLNERKGQDRNQEHNKRLFEKLTGGGE